MYDDVGQLIREDNALTNATYVYAYDNAGNITSRKKYSLTAAGTSPTALISTDSYTYSSGTWGDMLTAYKGISITYDAMGNPLSYYNGSSYTFTWSGRQLATASKGGISYSFTYNDGGIRTSKTRAGVKTSYYLSGSKIAAEETSGNLIIYIYDSEGLPLGMQYHGKSYGANVFDVYWFEKNIFGDIVAIYNQAGTKLISYTYDAYGNFTVSYSNGGENTTATKNPFRYRGYYFDQDLELYYLNSRYYDSHTCRFISPDTISIVTATPETLANKNLYAYCNNNPVMYKQGPVSSGGSIISSSISVGGSTAGVINTSAIKRLSKSVSASRNGFNLFRYELRQSAGWDTSPDIATGFFGRIGFSSYITHTKGQSGMLYAFAGITSDVMNWFGTTYYAGLGINLFDVIGAEVYLQIIGIGATINIWRLSVGADINLIGGTSITLGWNTDLGNGITKTDGFTVGINTGALVVIIVWFYKLATTGDPSPAPGMLPA